MATDGPERSGLAVGLPVPSSTTCVRVGAALCDCEKLEAGDKQSNMTKNEMAKH
jgi:hypothetical protein